MGFDFHIGKVMDSKSIQIKEGDFIGYHGTIDCFVNEFKDEIKRRKAKIRQFNGEGFYVAKDRDIVCYFAIKKAKDERKGKPGLLEIYAVRELVGKEVPPKLFLELNT